jgi:hypothetical protein
MTQKLHAVDPAVEVHEWVDTSNLSELVASFARIHILLAVFDGNPDRWLDMIAADGTPEEREKDFRFLIGLKKRMAERPTLLEELRGAIRDFARLIA